MLKSLVPVIFSLNFFKKLFAFLLFLAVLYLLKSFVPLFLITFIFAYLFLELGKYSHQKIQSYLDNTTHSLIKKFQKYLTVNVIVSVIYVVFVILLIFVFSTMVPRIGLELEKLIHNTPNIVEQFNRLISELETSLGIQLGIQNQINDFINSLNFKDFGNTILTYLQDAGGFLLRFMIGLLLSYIFIIDRTSIYAFLNKMKQGNFAFFYEEYKYLGSKIMIGFGRVFKAQSIIAILNSILTTLGLIILGYTMGHGAGFPYIFTLSLIVFIFGFIPVFGTFLSGLPILIIGYGIGEVPMVIGILVMITIIHAIEAYILNPKIVSSYTHFPIFITFVILLISEHIFGLLGLLIGIPIFSIALSMLEDLDRHITQIKNHIDTQKSCKP